MRYAALSARPNILSTFKIIHIHIYIYCFSISRTFAGDFKVLKIFILKVPP